MACCVSWIFRARIRWKAGSQPIGKSCSTATAKRNAQLKIEETAKAPIFREASALSIGLYFPSPGTPGEGRGGATDREVQPPPLTLPGSTELAEVRSTRGGKKNATALQLAQRLPRLDKTREDQSSLRNTPDRLPARVPDMLQ